MISLRTKIRDICCGVIAVSLVFLITMGFFARSNRVYAEDDGRQILDSHFVTFFDGGTQLTVKTESNTVGEALELAGIVINDMDRVEPSLQTEIVGSNFRVNIYRARPAIITDGKETKYLMTASLDIAQIARDAGFAVYDGDELKAETLNNFLETGISATYRIIRNGGRTITLDEPIAYTTEKIYDYTMAKGETRLERAGEDGRKVQVYNVLFEENKEVARELVSEEVVLEPISEVIVVGARPSIAPAQAQCAEWAREAGVSEADLPIAMTLIYRESGCRVDARNASSGAYGIPQSLPGNKMAAFGDDWETNPITQLRWMINYVNKRYGGWSQALAHSDKNGWY